MWKSTLLLTDTGITTDTHGYTHKHTPFPTNTGVIVHFPLLPNSGTGPISEFEG